MNLHSTLLQRIALITTIAGTLLTPNIAEAAGSAPVDTHETESHTEKELHDGQTSSPDKLVSLLTSKKAQQIELLSILGLIGMGVVVPEIFSKSQKNSSETKVSNLSDVELHTQFESSTGVQPPAQINGVDIETIRGLEGSPENLADFVERLDLVSSRENEHDKNRWSTQKNNEHQQTKSRRRRSRKSKAA